MTGGAFYVSQRQTPSRIYECVSAARRLCDRFIAMQHPAHRPSPMNTDCMFSPKSDLWETPQDFFDELNREFHFNLDVCALPENAKCARYFTPEQDGLKKIGGATSGAIRPMAGRSANGSKKPPRAARRWSCCCLRGRIRAGFMIASMARRKFALCAAV